MSLKISQYSKDVGGVYQGSPSRLTFQEVTGWIESWVAPQQTSRLSFDTRQIPIKNPSLSLHLVIPFILFVFVDNDLIKELNGGIREGALTVTSMSV